MSAIQTIESSRMHDLYISHIKQPGTGVKPARKTVRIEVWSTHFEEPLPKTTPENVVEQLAV